MANSTTNSAPSAASQKGARDEPDFRAAISERGRKYRVWHRDSEEFEAFTARIEREEAEYETTNQTTTEGV